MLSASTFRGGGAPSPPSALDRLPHRLVGSGTEAILLALLELGTARRDRVALPSFCCKVMLEPIRALGAEPLFYRVDEDLSPSLSHVEEVLGARPKALLAVHYFGVCRDFSSLRSLCDQRQVVLVEDCAHCFFGDAGAAPVGSFGTYAAGSTTKFFPGMDGGLLCSSAARFDTSLAARAVRRELKSAYAMLADATAYRRLAVLRPFLSLARAIVAVRDRFRREQSAGPAPCAPRLRPSVPQPMTWPSRLVLRHASRARLIGRRRDAFAFLCSRFASLKRAKVLHPSLPQQAVPYMVPLLLDDTVDADRVYFTLKRKGVPVWRWDEADNSCPTSAAYSRRLLQLPCHQELGETELVGLAEAVWQTLLDE